MMDKARQVRRLVLWSRMVAVSFAGTATFALLASAAFGVDHDGDVHGPYDCQGAIGVPVTIELTVDEEVIAKGANGQIAINVRADDALEDVSVTFSTRGAVQISAARSSDRQFLAEADSIALTLPVRYLDIGDATVNVDVKATIAGSGFTFSKRAELNVLLREDRAFAGMEHPFNLRRRALDYDVSAKSLTTAEEASRRRALSTADAVPGAPAAPFAPLNPTLAGLTIEPASVEDDPNHVEEIGPRSLSTNVRVHGIVQYQDETGTAHPVYGYGVQIRDDDTIGSDLILEVTTGTDGRYDVTFDFDDPDGPDVFVRFRPVNARIEVRQLGGGDYENDTAISDDVPSNTTLEHNITFANFGTGPIASVCSGMSYIAAYTRDFLDGGVGLGQIPVEYPGSTGAAFYNGSLINMRPNDAFDWDVMHHEYGHYVMDSYNFENNPGGAHNLGWCISINKGSKSAGTRMAWGEGWPTFFGTSGQNELGLGAIQAPRVGDVSYTDTGFPGGSHGWVHVQPGNELRCGRRQSGDR